MNAIAARHRLLPAAGLLALGAAWLGPLPDWSRHAFSAHMSMHMAVVAIAAPLLALGIAGSRVDPARRWPGWFGPMVASIIEFLVVWAWHAPALHHAARASAPLLALEQASFLAVGLLLWCSAFGGGQHRRRERAAAGIGGLLLTSMHMTLLGVLLAVATRPLYTHAGGTATAIPFGLAPLQDQHLGGVIMLAVGGSAYLAGALWLLAGLLRESAGAHSAAHPETVDG
ncbi:MAG TPA: cytochrome c oxidase assembly protein [Xanthomonadaceae bacterium]|nr:cytochrome c oxidase assembly protein [Xanthomonadaceae bacterium]